MMEGDPVLKKKKKTIIVSAMWWLSHLVILALLKAKAGGSLEPRSLRPTLAT
jgi:hypothetical protein